MKELLSEVYILSFERCRTLIVGWLLMHKSSLSDEQKQMGDLLIAYLDNLDKEILESFIKTYNEIYKEGRGK